MTTYEMELIAALESGIRRWEVLAMCFEQKVPEVEIQGMLKISGREFASNLREKGNRYRKLVERMKRG